MSSFVCDDDHITALAAAAVRLALGPSGALAEMLSKLRRNAEGNPSDLALFAEELYRENCRSFDTNYPLERHAKMREHGGWNFNPAYGMARTFEPVQIIKSCECYAYQASEHEGWESSNAHQIIESIKAAAIKALPGYASAAWGIP